MRGLVALLVVAALARAGRADGPDEPRLTPPATPVEVTPQPQSAAQPQSATSAPTVAAQPQSVTPAPTVATPSGDAEEVVPNPPRLRAIIVGAAAGGLFVIGGALGGAALSRASEQTGNAANPQPYTQALADRGAEGQSLAIAAYVFFAAGAAVAIADAVLWVETLRKPRVIKRSVADRLIPLGVRF
jgi:hypothetical protein